MEAGDADCSVCGGSFEVRFRYQVQEESGRFSYFCSQKCQQTSLGRGETCVCTVCGRGFLFEAPSQVSVGDGERRYRCSVGCKERESTVRRARPGRRIAVFNHKGGTGKTTTAIHLAAGFSGAGKRVLLVDADAQGNVAAALGLRPEKSLYHVLVQGVKVSEAILHVGPNLDVLCSNEALAAAELYLAGRPNRDRVLRERMGGGGHDYDVVVIDCAPALSLMNQNALVYADAVVVPVSCDYLSLVGLKQVLKTLRSVRELLGHSVELLGVIPTMLDVRNRSCAEALELLRQHFADRCLPSIRVNARLREAPHAHQTVFDLAPESHGAHDYRALVKHLMGKLEEATVSAAQPTMTMGAMQ